MLEFERKRDTDCDSSMLRARSLAQPEGHCRWAAMSIFHAHCPPLDRG